MSVPLYSLRITAVGEYVEYSLRELRLILFSDAVPDDIVSYCAVHQSQRTDRRVIAPSANEIK